VNNIILQLRLALRDKVKLPRRLSKEEYDDQETLKGRNFVREAY
jgi:hypothetical protein